VQRQYLGCLGKVDNGIVTVHIGLARGRFQALLDADLYLPRSWDADRPRCRAAGVPDDVRYRPKWRIALDQLTRLSANGVTFDWLAFDEGYGAAVPLLKVLSLAGQRFVAEVPINFAVADVEAGPTRRADQRLSAARAKSGRRYCPLVLNLCLGVRSSPPIGSGSRRRASVVRPADGLRGLKRRRSVLCGGLRP
jgi:SRSO17 transposase